MRIKDERFAYCDIREHGCYEKLPRKQMIRMRWKNPKRKKKYADACPNCFQKVHKGEVKDLDIRLKDLPPGHDRLDVKSEYETWRKNLVDYL